MNPDSIKAIGKLDNLNQLFKENGVEMVILDTNSPDRVAVRLRVGNSDYYFNPPIKTEEYTGLDDKTHTRTILKYDGWEKHL